MPRVKGYVYKPHASRRSKRGTGYKPVGIGKGWSVTTFRNFKKAVSK